MQYTKWMIIKETRALRSFKFFRNTLGFTILVLLVAGCRSTRTIRPDVPSETPGATAEPMTPTPLVRQEASTATATEAVQPTASATSVPPATATSTETSLPPGFGIVPDFRGISLAEARTQVASAGFTFLFQDVLNPEVPTGTIVDQDPPTGTALPFGEIIFLYRSFQALEMYAGGACQTLRITLPAGKLLYWVELDEGVRYEVRTDFAQGRTQISDYRMYLMGEFDNATRDSMDFIPLAPGQYVISLGPYEVSKTKLESEGSLSAGCLWITPEDLNLD